MRRLRNHESVTTSVAAQQDAFHELCRSKGISEDQGDAPTYELARHSSELVWALIIGKLAHNMLRDLRN